MTTSKTLSAFILLLIIVACTNQKKDNSKPTEDDFKILHLNIERSETEKAKASLDTFFTKFKIPLKATNLPEGHYSAESPYDDFHYSHIIEFDVKDGKFTNVEYDEVEVGGGSKKTNKKYGDKMNEHVAGSAPSLTYLQYETQLEEKQDLLQMDAISGATYSLYRFQLVAAKAINEKLQEK